MLVTLESTRYDVTSIHNENVKNVTKFISELVESEHSSFGTYYTNQANTNKAMFTSICGVRKKR